MNKVYSELIEKVYDSTQYRVVVAEGKRVIENSSYTFKGDALHYAFEMAKTHGAEKVYMYEEIISKNRIDWAWKLTKEQLEEIK